jgi:arylsulfatase A-like enzyme
VSVVHLVDGLDRAGVEAPSPAHVQVQEMDCGGAPRTSLFEHPNSTATFDLPLALGGRLQTAVGIKRLAWERVVGAVRFRVGVRRRGRIVWAWEHVLDPRTREEDRGWVPADIRLPRGDAVVLATLAEAGGHAWAGWADPVVEPRRLAGGRLGVPRRPSPAPAHVLMLTADSLRADHVADPAVATPNLDRLGREGVAFTHARTGSLATPASYGTIVSGLSPLRHGVVGEWGRFPPELATLPAAMARSGRTTVFAPSEHEVGRDEQGFAPAFAETLRCVGNPSQDGAVTARRVAARIEEAADQPLFVWAEFFDCHPPRRMPDGCVSHHYQGDPRNPARRFEPERVAAIRASETVLELELRLPSLRAGRTDARLTRRLRDTARTLAGELDHGPDLAEHLRALGLDRDGLAQWLADRAVALDRGEVPRDLVPWLEGLREPLRAVEREALAWLDGVVDYRWPLAQIPAAVEHFDAHVGTVLDALDALGLGDTTTVVVASPHGECFGEGGHHFTHHEPHEISLRVPLIVRPAAGAGVRRGRVGGTMDLVDLAPTLLDVTGCPVPAGLDGHGRAAALRAGEKIPDHASFALGIDATLACAVRGGRKLVQTLEPLGDSSPGDRVWLDADTDEPGEADAALAAELERWLEVGAAETRRGPCSMPVS